jgi:protein TonB
MMEAQGLSELKPSLPGNCSPGRTAEGKLVTQFQFNSGSYRTTHTAPQRIAGILFIAALHAAIVYAFLTALGFVPMPQIPMPFIGYVIPDDTVVPLPPPPEQPVIAPPRITELAPPIIEIPLQNSAPGAITPSSPPSTQPERQVSLEPPTSPAVSFTPARAIAATHTIPEYPALSRRLGEQGTLRLKVAVTADGAVSEAQVESSSGHQRLDEAAVQWVKAHWRYEPARQGAKPIPSTAVAVVTFKLQ